MSDILKIKLHPAVDSEASLEKRNFRRTTDSCRELHITKFTLFLNKSTFLDTHLVAGGTD